MNVEVFVAYMRRKGYEFWKPIRGLNPGDSRRLIFVKAKPPPDEPFIVPVKKGRIPLIVVERIKRLLE